MHRKPLATLVVLGAVLGAVVAGATAASAAPARSGATAHSTNRGWDVPPRDLAAQLD